MSFVACVTDENLLRECDYIPSKIITKLNKLSLRLSDFNNNQFTSECPSTYLHHIFSPTSRVTQVAISSTHVAFLLESNEICRVKYQVLPLRATNSLSNPITGSKFSDIDDKHVHFSIGTNLSANNINTINLKESTLVSNNDHLEKHRSESHLFDSSTSLRRRGIQSLRSTSRALNMRNLGRYPAPSPRRNYLINPRRTIGTPADVPEDLITQAQAVLQGKTRSMIFRELQRTGLDVNQAVNNLLSREDDGEDDEITPTVLGSEELFYLFETGGSSVPMRMELSPQDPDGSSLESFVQPISRISEFCGNEYISGRESRLGFSSPNNHDSYLDRLSDIICSYSSLPGVPPPQDVSTSNTGEFPLITKDTENIDIRQNSTKRKDTAFTDFTAPQRNCLSPRIQFIPGLLWWVNGEPDHSFSFLPPHQCIKFSRIVSTDTDLIAITISGHLAYWPWDEPNGNYLTEQHTFPFSPNIDIKSTDHIKLISSSRFRVALITEGNCLASMSDRTLHSTLFSLGSSIDTTVNQLRINPNQTVTSLTCSDLFSACITSDGYIFWSGFLPYPDRKRTIMRIKNKFQFNLPKSNRRTGCAFHQDVIREGSMVVIRQCPFYSIGTRAINFQRNALVGILQENIYSLNEKCRFKLFIPSSCSQGHEPSPPQGSSTEKSTTFQPPVNEHSYSVIPSTQSWHCKDVIFLDEPRFHSSPGHVIKIEGNLAVVCFLDKFGDASRQKSVDLSSCRLVKKEDLILQRSSLFLKNTVCTPTAPKRLNIRPNCKPVTITASNKGLYLLYTSNHIPKLGIISLESSKIENVHILPSNFSNYFTQNKPVSLNVASSQSYFFVQDNVGNFLPLIKSQSNTFKEVPFIPLPPVTAFTSYYNSQHKIFMMLFSCNKNILTPFIMNSSHETLLNMFGNVFKGSQLLHEAKNEHTNGNFNLFHTAIRASLHSTSSSIDNDIVKTPTNKETSNSNCPVLNKSSSIHLEKDCGMTSIFSSLQSNSSKSPEVGKFELNMDFSENHPVLSTKASSDNLKCIENLIILMDLDLLRLFSERNLDGQTPFMLAVHERMYDAALLILAAIIRISMSFNPRDSKDDLILDMIYPLGSVPDDNPLFMLCANDVCSVTWTGESHESSIDIYECHTCGLIGDYCCCSECSRVCHKGHNCQKKKQPMKAFCDCRKLCHCRSMIPGNQFLRLRLLKELLSLKKLQSVMNSHSEYIISFLMCTFARQFRERIHKDISYKISNLDPLSGTQEQFIFSKCALDVCLADWKTIEAVFLNSGNVQSSLAINNFHSLQDVNLPTNESNVYIHSQHGTTHIERFVYTLLLHNSSELVSQLLLTLNNANKRNEVNISIVISRFLRTVIRIFLISSFDQWAPHPLQIRKRNQNIQHLSQLIFRSMNKLAMMELWRIAKSLVIPIQLGIVKCCNPLSIEAQKRNVIDDIFRSPNLPFPSNINAKIDADSTSCSDNSHDSDFVVNEYDSLATQDDISTRAVIESSNIIPYISGDSTSDSDDNHPEEVIDSALELIEVPNTFSIMGANSSVSPNNLSINTGLIDIAKPTDFSPLDYNSISLNTIQDSIQVPIEPNLQVGSPYNLNLNLPTIAPNLESHYSLLNSEFDDTQWRVNTECSLSWRPDFDILSHRNSFPTSLNKRKNNVSYPQEPFNPSNSHQELILARSFHFLIDKLVDVLKHLPFNSLFSITWVSSDIDACFKEIWYEMEPIILWLIHVMDPLESQLRFGSSLVSPYTAFLTGKLPNDDMSSSIPRVVAGQEVNFPYLRGNTSPNYEPISTKPTMGMDSLDYLLSLTRSSFNEHRDFLPPINLNSMEHIARILDAILYFLYNQPNEIHLSNLKKQSQPIDLNSKFVSVSNNDCLHHYDRIETTPTTSTLVFCREIDGKQKEDISSFFQRSSCMSFFGCPKPNHLAPIETIPCAEMPHLIQPQTRREILFSPPQDPIIPDPVDESPFHFMNTLTCLLSLPLIKCFSHLDRLTSFRSLFKSIIELRDFENHQGHLNFKRAADIFLGRWRLSIELFCKLLYEKDGCDSVSMLQLLQDFPSKENKFREGMEKLTLSVGKDQRDLLLDVSRDRRSLFLDTCHHLYRYVECHKDLLFPLCVKQVKVTFKHEQGEGSGVARSFYTSFAEAILSDEDLPSLDGIPLSCDLPNLQSQEVGNDSIEESYDNPPIIPLNHSASPFRPYHPSIAHMDKISQGTYIYHQVTKHIGSLHSKLVTGILLDLPISLINSLCDNPNLLTRYVRSAYEEVFAYLPSALLPPSYHDLTGSLELKDLSTPLNVTPNPYTIDTDIATFAKKYKSCEFSDLTPLFFQPGKSGFYSPRAAKYTAQRSLAYLCIGRIIGLCLLTAEIFPAPFTRHVFKHLMGKGDTICWQDYAFMDPVGFESLRKILLLAQEESSDNFNSLGLTFQISLSNYESNELVDLVNNGSETPVTISNVEYYVKLYTEYRMKHVVRESLIDMHLGLSDVIPIKYFTNITPEDLRLMLNGCFSFNLDSLRRIVIVNNESKEDNKSVSKFIKWFWCLVKGFSEKDKQDLLYFWTSSPKMPSNICSYQPEPSIHVRPPEEDYLPTANTCIARLYIPLYSTRSHLKSKMLLAIRTKTFGFV